MASDSPQPRFDALVSRARDGDRVALGELLELYRSQLRAIASEDLDRRLGARVDASDIVQQTMLSVFKHFDQFTGTDEAEFLAWLRHVHRHNVLDAARQHLHAQGRSVSRQARVGESSIDPLEGHALQQTTPSQHAMRGEEVARLVQLLESLPADQRDAVRLRHLEGWTLSAIAEHLGRSPEAAAGLIKRGLQNLKRHLSSSD